VITDQFSAEATPPIPISIQCIHVLRTTWFDSKRGKI